MQYLCTKQLTFAGKTYRQGDTIPDGVILPERAFKLERNGLIQKLEAEQDDSFVSVEVGDGYAVQATPEDICQVFAIMQLDAKEAAKAISDVTSENVLILLNAADSRKTVKEAAKTQADNIFPTNEATEDGEGNTEASEENAEAGTNAEGADT